MPLSALDQAAHIGSADRVGGMKRYSSEVGEPRRIVDCRVDQSVHACLTIRELGPGGIASQIMVERDPLDPAPCDSNEELLVGSRDDPSSAARRVALVIQKNSDHLAIDSAYIM